MTGTAPEVPDGPLPGKAASKAIEQGAVKRFGLELLADPADILFRYRVVACPQGVDGVDNKRLLNLSFKLPVGARVGRSMRRLGLKALVQECHDCLHGRSRLGHRGRATEWGTPSAQPSLTGGEELSGEDARSRSPLPEQHVGDRPLPSPVDERDRREIKGRVRNDHRPQLLPPRVDAAKHQSRHGGLLYPR